jgi:hypothetical protein
MTPRVFARIPTCYNADIFGDAYSDMTDEEIDLDIKLYDAIITSLLPDWLRWCGDELYADFDTDNREWAPEVDEDFDINDILAEACQILWSRDADKLAAIYLPGEKGNHND